MAFRIKRSERVAAAVRRIVGEELDAARLEATDETAPLGERVHAVRSRLKKARAALRLVRRAGGRRVADEERALRDVARSLARARDAAIVRAALRELSPPARRRRADEPSAGDRVADEHDLRLAAEQLGALRRRAGAWKVKGGGRAARAAFARGYRRGRRLMDGLSPDHDGRPFHEWRKAVKRLALQLRLVNRVAPELRQALEGPLEELSDLLGELHDLALLQERLEARDDTLAPAGERRALLPRLVRRLVEKRAQALELGARAFATPPRELRERLDSAWRAWRR